MTSPHIFSGGSTGTCGASHVGMRGWTSHWRSRRSRPRRGLRSSDGIETVFAREWRRNGQGGRKREWALCRSDDHAPCRRSVCRALLGADNLARAASRGTASGRLRDAVRSLGCVPSERGVAVMAALSAPLFCPDCGASSVLREGEDFACFLCSFAVPVADVRSRVAAGQSLQRAISVRVQPPPLSVGGHRTGRWAGQ